jgi:2-polyprenyl-3-methyl-5-hydroxy-6-metoxy-1,4-benzoquinol methylase
LTKERHGEFDVVLCLGILYHLDTPDVLRFVEQIAGLCKRFAVFYTFIGLKKARAVDFQGKTYWGRDMREHANESSPEERLRDV